MVPLVPEAPSLRTDEKPGCHWAHFAQGPMLLCVQMPDELLYDPQVIELREEIKALQAEFVNAHKALDAAQQHVK